MLIGFLFSRLREPSTKAFLELPRLLPRTPLPADVVPIRFSLMRALQGVRNFALYRFGNDDAYRRYMVGPWPLQPVIGEVLIRHGWVRADDEPWPEAIARYELSSAGITLADDLESWWASLTLGQRMRAAIVE